MTGANEDLELRLVGAADICGLEQLRETYRAKGLFSAVGP